MITERRSVQHTCFPCVWDPSPPVHSSQCPGPSANDSIVCCLFKIIPWKKNCEIEYKYKSMHNRWPKNENINTMKNSNNCTLDWLDSLDCYSCMTPTAKLATAPPRNAMSGRTVWAEWGQIIVSIALLTRAISVGRRECDNMMGQGSPRISRGRRPAGREWRHAVHAVSTLASVHSEPGLNTFQWQWTMRILAFILSTSNWILGKNCFQFLQYKF